MSQQAFSFDRAAFVEQATDCCGADVSSQDPAFIDPHNPQTGNAEPVGGNSVVAKTVVVPHNQSPGPELRD